MEVSFYEQWERLVKMQTTYQWAMLSFSYNTADPHEMVQGETSRAT